MDFLRSLWPNSSSNVITIPQHLEGEMEDELDLKMKSLIYLFKRLNVENLPAFMNDENGVYNFDNDGNPAERNEKLDAIYNKSEFERQLCSDEHRILIDWFKNKFRSIMILSADIPSGLIEQSKLAKGFQFTVLKPECSDDEYISTLLVSDIYLEHPIDKSIKTTILKNIITNQRTLKPSFRQSFNKNDRSAIILSYLSKLSEFIQIERIYKATIIKNIENYKSLKLGQIKEDLDEFDDVDEENDENGVIRLFPNNGLKSRSRSRSPVRSRRYSNDHLKPMILSPMKLAPTPVLSPSKTTTPSTSPLRSSNLSNQSPQTPTSIPTTPTKFRSSRPTSPMKSLKKKQSMTILKMDKSLDSSSLDSNDSSKEDSVEELISKEELQNIKAQSTQAVLSRVERERRILRGT